MRFTISAAALAALISTALAQTSDFDPIFTPTKDEKVPAGKDYEITWQSVAKYPGGVTLSVLGGADPGSLQPIGTIGKADNSAGKFKWSVASDLGSEVTYGIQITLDSDKTVFQYSMPFHITGASGGSHNGSTSASGTATYTISTVTTDSSSSYPTYTPPSGGNYTTPGSPPKTTITSTSGSGPTGTTTGGSTQNTSGANARAAGPLAAIGALVMAALAL